MTKLQLNVSWLGLNLAYTGPHPGLGLITIVSHCCVRVVCIPLIPSQKSNGYDLLKIRLRKFCQQRDLEMSISESGPCSQVKQGLWEEKGRSLVFVDKGSLFGGEI